MTRPGKALLPLALFVLIGSIASAQEHQGSAYAQRRDKSVSSSDKASDKTSGKASYAQGRKSPEQEMQRFSDAAKSIPGARGPLIQGFTARVLSSRGFQQKGVSEQDVDNVLGAMSSYLRGTALLRTPNCPPELLKQGFDLRRQAQDLLSKSGELQLPFFQAIAAMRGFERACRSESPDFLNAYLNASDAYEGKRYADALQDYRAAVTADSRNAQAWSGLSSALLHLGQYEQAYRDASRAHQLDPADPNALAVMKFSEGRVSVAGAGAPAAAPAPAVASLAQEPVASSAGELTAAASPRPLNELQQGAREALRLGDPAAAEAELSRALALDPKNPRTLALRSMARSRRRNFSGAMEDANAGLALSPTSKPLLHAKAYAQIRGRLWNEGLSTANALLEVDPSDPYAYAYRAHAYGGLGDREAMLADLRRATQIDPRFADAFKAAGALRLPSDSDILFLFPGEAGTVRPALASSLSPTQRFGWVVGASLLIGLVLALALLKRSRVDASGEHSTAA